MTQLTALLSVSDKTGIVDLARALHAQGVKLAEELLRKHLQDQGDWPRGLVVDLWGSATMRTAGEEFAMALHLEDRQATDFPLLELFHNIVQGVWLDHCNDEFHVVSPFVKQLVAYRRRCALVKFYD